MKKITEKIYLFRKKIIKLDELKDIISKKTYIELTEAISELEKSNVIKYVKDSGLNGMTPPLYMRYHIIPPEKDYSDILSEIKSLHHFINAEKYRKFPEKYGNVRNLIFTLSEYLKSKSDDLKTPMSENERAYAIWHDEKILDKAENVLVLKETGVFEKLNVYSTPEPFFDYRINSVSKNVLIVENKDTWFTLRKIMIEKGTEIHLFGKSFDCVLYGEGNKATRSESSIADYLALDDFNGFVYYWGDLDYEGIGIFLLTAKVNGGLAIKPFVSAYEKMLCKFGNIYSDDRKKEFMCRKEQKVPKNMDGFLSCFDEETQKTINKYLIDGLYIPQEIINYHVIKNCME